MISIKCQQNKALLFHLGQEAFIPCLFTSVDCSSEGGPIYPEVSCGYDYQTHLDMKITGLFCVLLALKWGRFM